MIETARKYAQLSSGRFHISDSMDAAYDKADIVYSKSWAPMHVMQARTELLINKNDEKLKELEKEGLSYNAKYKDWECIEQKMASTKGGAALYMHCLPADITGVSCEQGEVQKEVFEKYRIKTYIEAGFKPYVIASMILNNKFKKPEILLESVCREPKKFRTNMF